MKKFILPLILNIMILFILPAVLSVIGDVNAKSAMVGMVAFGNAVYFFIQGQLYSSKYKNAWQLMIINALFIVLYCFVFLNGFILIYFALYLVLCFLGIRIGSVKRKIKELKDNGGNNGI